jgi:hypothetical protein
MKVLTAYNNFSRGRIDHDMMGRFDLPIYQSGADFYENFISNFKGNAIYRKGFKSIVAFEDCVMAEFNFNNTQNYVLFFYANKIRFMSFDINGNFGWVLSAGVPIEVATPYTLAECEDLDYTQNFDTMIFTHPNHAPRKLVRTAANAFTFKTFAIKDDPFGLTFGANITITGITKAANGVVTTSAAHGLTTGQSAKFSGVVGMTQINGYTAIVTVLTATTFSIDVDTTTFTAYSSGGIVNQVLTSDYPACCLFYKSRLYYAATTAKLTTIWGSEQGFYDTFTLPVTVLDTSALQATIAEISQKIEWLFAGDNSLIVGSASGIVAVNGGGVGNAITADTIEFTLTSADGCNKTYPLRKDGYVFYVGRNNRNLYYFNYDLLTESFVAADANFISYDITAGGLGKIRHKKDRNDIIYSIRGDGDLVTLNFKKDENIIGFHSQETNGLFEDMAVITNNNGDPQLIALVQRNGVFYIEQQADFVEFSQRINFFTDKDSQQIDDVAYVRKVAEELKSCVYLDGALIYSDLKSNLITYNAGLNKITATSSVFVLGDVGKHIVYKTATGYESGRFEITAFIDAFNVTVSVLQEPTSNTYTDWYLSFSSLSGLSQFNGTTVGVVTDGGYLSDFEISGGVLSFTGQVTHTVIGYRYKGLIKSFCLGFQAGAENTQVTMKAISRAHLRCVASAGGLFGASPYHLEPVQELGQQDINYLPPIPIDGIKSITLSDDNAQDKFFYIVQEAPLPLCVTAIMLDANYSTTR